MAFHTGSPPSPMLNQTEGNPIRISVQQGWNDPSVTHDEAAMTQVCPLHLCFMLVDRALFAASYEESA